MTYSTKQVVSLTGLSKDTLRYYEQIGILNVVARDKNQYRMYSEDDISWLKMVKLMRAMGVKPEAFVGQQGSSIAERRMFTAQYRQEVKRQIKELKFLDHELSQKLTFLDNLASSSESVESKN